jgi:CheY-like chemotaxis protein
MLLPKTHTQSVDLKSRLPPTISRLPAPAFDTRILIVDQDRQVGVTLSFMLATRRFDEVRSVRSTRRAMAVAEQFLPDIVFIDLDLPEGGGIPVARWLAREARRRRPRLIALTNHSADPSHDEARAAGFERLLAKPVLHEELDKILRIGAPLAHHGR